MKVYDKETGQVVRLDDSTLSKTLATGRYVVPKGQAVPIDMGGGAVGTVDAAQVTQALRAGDRVASPEVAAYAQQEARYGGLGGAAQAFGVGALRGLGGAFMLPTDALIAGAGSMTVNKDLFGNNRLENDKQAMLQGLQAANPIASFSGELGGALLPALVGDEAGLLSLAGRGAEGAAARMGGGLVTKLAARGLVEGAGYGATQTINESALGNTELTAEKFLAGMGHGALLGGALSGGLGAAMSGTQYLGGKAFNAVRKALSPAEIEQVAANHFGVAAPGLGKLIAREADQAAEVGGLRGAYLKASSSASGAPVDALEALTRGGAEGAAARRVAVYDAPAIQDAAARTLRSAGDEFLAAERAIADEAKGALKAEYVRKAVKTGNEADVAAIALGKTEQALSEIQSQLSEGAGFTKSLESISTSAYRTQKTVADAVKSGVDVNAKTFIALDQFKRDVQALTRKGYQGVRNVSDPIDRVAAEKSVAWMDGFSQKLRAGLEDEATWGKAAIDQRRINAAWSEQIDAGKRFRSSLTTDVGRDPLNPYVQARGIDPAKAESYVKNLTNPNKDLTHQAVTKYLDSTEAWAREVAQSYELPAEKMAELRKLEGAAKTFRGAVNESEKSLVLANQYKAIKDADSGVSGLLSALGFAGGGVLGGIAGTIAGGVVNPAKTIAQLAAVERAIAAFDAKAGTKIAQLIQGGGSGGGAKVGFASRGAFESKARAALEDGLSIGSVRARASSAVAAFADAAPGVAASVVTRTAEIASYVATKMPAGLINNQTPGVLQPKFAPPRYSDAQMHSASQYLEAMEDPLSILDDARRGYVSKEKVDLMRRFYPNVLKQLQYAIQTAAAQSKNPISRERRLALGPVVGVAADIDLTAKSLQAIQSAISASSVSPQSVQGKGKGSSAKIVRVQVAKQSKTQRMF